MTFTLLLIFYLNAVISLQNGNQLTGVKHDLRLMNISSGYGQGTEIKDCSQALLNAGFYTGLVTQFE